LLFVFLKTSLPKDHEGDEEARFNAGQGGELQPVMCVDKTLDQLGSFSDLVEEAAQMKQEWQLVLVAALSGHNGVAPSVVEAEKSLQVMVHGVESGGDLSRYMAFDREGSPVQFS